MSSSLNKVQIIGNLGRDPEIKSFPDGGMLANLAVATTRKWKTQQGEAQEETEWHRVTIQGKTADVAKQYLSKGSKVYIEGRLRTRKWEKDGVDHFATEIICGRYDGRLILLGDGQQRQAQPAPQQASTPQQMPQGPQPVAVDTSVALNDDIPF